MPFTINGADGVALKSETRLLAASAIVLASKWERTGYRNVTITEEGCEPETLADIRRRLHNRSIWNESVGGARSLARA